MGHARAAAERSAALLPGDGHFAGPGHGPVHFDILVADLASAHDRVIEAGATPAGEYVSPRPGPGTLEGLPRPGRPSLLPGHSLATSVRWIHAVSADSFTRNLIFR